jgi:hypothetical protein
MVHDDYCVPDWQWRISDGIAKGLLPDDPKWSDVEFSVPQAPSIDNGRDSANDREDLRAGLTSFSAIAKKRGVDFRKTFKEHVQDILFAKQVVAETGGMVSFEEAMQRFTNMQPQPKEVEESAEDEVEDATEAVTDPEDEGDETEEQAPNPIIPN